MLLDLFIPPVVIDMIRHGILTLCLLATVNVYAEGPAASEIQLYPTEFTLIGPRSRQQLLATAIHSPEDQRDATFQVQWASSDESVVRIVDGIAHPVSNGTAQITARLGETTVAATVTVQGPSNKLIQSASKRKSSAHSQNPVAIWGPATVRPPEKVAFVCHCVVTTRRSIR